MVSRIIIFLISLCLPMFVSAQSKIETFFDIIATEETAVDVARFEDFFPSEFLKINSSKSFEENHIIVNDTRKKWIKNSTPELISTESNELPLPYLFSSFFIEHDRSGRLDLIGFSERNFPIRRNRIVNLYRLLENSIGPSDSVMVSDKIRDTIPSEIYVVWNRPKGIVILEFDVSRTRELAYRIELYFYPETSSSLKNFGWDRKTKIKLGDSTWKTVEAFLNHHAAFREGDGPFPPIPIADSLEQRLEQYHDSVLWKEYASFRERPRFIALFQKLEAALEEEFSDFRVPERYQRILDIATSSRSGVTQVSAATFLAHYNDPATQPFLRQGLNVELPSGVSASCAQGLAKFCTGDQLHQTVEDFLQGDKHAEVILVLLPTRKQIGEFWRIRDRIPDASNQRKLDQIRAQAR